MHEGGYRIDADDIGGFIFHRPDRSVLPEVPRALAGSADALPDLHGTVITAQTTVPSWTGERLDLHHAVWVHTQQTQRASAEAFRPDPPSESSLN